MGNVSDSGSVRTFEDLLESFTYKVRDNKINSRRCRRPSTAGGTVGADGKRGGSRVAAAAAEGIRRPSPPNTPPPPPQHNSRRRRRSSCPSSPSSYIRATVGGKTVVVSKYFPLPPAASDPIVVDKKEIERPGKQRTRRRTASEGDSTVAMRRQTRRRMGTEDDDDGLKQQQKKRRTKMNQRTQLSAAEKKSDAYRRVSSNNMWEPPPSCHNLLQERHSFDPWRVLIICMLLNITTGRQVRRVLPGLFLLCPNAEIAANIPEEEIERVIQTLGLQRKRARMIKQFSREYLGNEWTHVTQLHGVGKYAADAYAIFCVGKPEAVIPEDHKLIDYWKFVCEKKDTEDDIIVLN